MGVDLKVLWGTSSLFLHVYNIIPEQNIYVMALVVAMFRSRNLVSPHAWGMISIYISRAPECTPVLRTSGVIVLPISST